jgi:probable rRNA maturation factor
MLIEVLNRQRRRRMDGEHWRAFAEKALREADAGSEGATIVFVSDRAIRELNKRFRGRDAATDVLSFPTERAEFEAAEDFNSGDVVISVERAARQAAEHGLKFDEEIAQLILHGLLHLSGYDHETDKGEMNRLEIRLRRRLGI